MVLNRTDGQGLESVLAGDAGQVRFKADSRPYGTRSKVVPHPALKRWAIPILPRWGKEHVVAASRAFARLWCRALDAALKRWAISVMPRWGKRLETVARKRSLCL